MSVAWWLCVVEDGVDCVYGDRVAVTQSVGVAESAGFDVTRGFVELICFGLTDVEAGAICVAGEETETFSRWWMKSEDIVALVVGA